MFERARPYWRECIPKFPFIGVHDENAARLDLMQFGRDVSAPSCNHLVYRALSDADGLICRNSHDSVPYLSGEASRLELKGLPPLLFRPPSTPREPCRVSVGLHTMVRDEYRPEYMRF